MNHFILFFSSSFALAQGARWQSESHNEIIAIGDLHGDSDAFLEILTNANILDRDGNIIDRPVDLVLNGDYVDRGHHSLEVLSIIKHLKENETSNFRVWINLGNHDIQLISGYIHYLSKTDLEHLAERGSNLSNPVLDKYAGLMQRYTSRFYSEHETTPPEDQLLIDAYKELVKTIAKPDGVFEFLANHSTAFIKLGENGFVHAGIEEVNLQQGVENLNSLLQLELKKQVQQFRQMLDGTLKSKYNYFSDVFFGNDSLLWTKKISQGEIEDTLFKSWLSRLGIQKLVVGHSPTKSKQVESSYDGKLIKIDTSISSVYKGNLVALKILNGKAEQIGPFERVENHPLKQKLPGVFSNNSWFRGLLTRCSKLIKAPR